MLYGLDSDSAAAAFVSIPNNYARVQAVLSAVPAAEGALVRDTMKGHNDGFSGASLHLTDCILNLDP